MFKITSKKIEPSQVTIYLQIMAGEKLFITNATQQVSGFEKSFPFKPIWHSQNPSVFYIILIVGTALVIIVLVVGMIVRVLKCSSTELRIYKIANETAA